MQQSAKGWLAGNGTHPPLMGLHVATPQTVADGLLAVPDLGPFEGWPPHLKSVFGILSHACSPMFLVWDCPFTGQSISGRILFYNTAYLDLIQATLTAATGSSSPVALEIHHWQALWDRIQGDVEKVLTTGHAIQRRGTLENVRQPHERYRWSYSAVWDEKGQISGVFATGYRDGLETLETINPKEKASAHFESRHESRDRHQSQPEQRQLLEVLATERAWFEAVLRQMPEGVLIADAASGKLVLSNERAQQILHHSYTLNLPLETYRQAVPFEVCHANGQRYALEDYPLGRSLRNGEVVTHEEMELRHVDGGRTIISANSAPILDANGDITAAVVVIQDITDRKQAEAALRQNEERLRLAQQAAGAGLWDWDIVANQVAWSDAYYRLYGLETTVAPSYEQWLACIAQVDRDRVKRVVQEALEHRADLNVEFRILHSQQGELWLTAIGQTFYAEDGQPTRMTGITLDITKRKQAEKALDRYRLLSEHTRDIVLYFCHDGRILEANQAAVEAYGYDRAELLTLKITDLRTAETQATISEQFTQAMQGGILFETVHQRKDGSCFPVEVSSQSAAIDGESVVLSVIRNITERKKAEREREQYLAQEQAAREVAEAAEQRARFLSEASTTLNSSLDYEYTLRRVAEAVVPTLADWCAIDILKDDGTLERLATTHVNPDKVQWGLELHRRYPPDLNAPHGVAQVLRTGQSQYYPEISDAQLVAAARDATHLETLREVGMTSFMLVPLNARGRTLGAISFVWAESQCSYGPADLTLAEELAHRAAIALDNARLYQDAQQARKTAERAAERTACLQAVTAALSESLTPTQVAEVIISQSKVALAADAALIALCSEDGTALEIVQSAGYDRALEDGRQRFSLDAPLPLTEAVRTKQPIWPETLSDRLTQYPHLAEAYLSLPFQAWISLPLVLEDKALGGLSLAFKHFRPLNQEDRDFILALTQQCAQAIVRAQLYAAEQNARAEAEQANRMKDEFLAILSHELRSPLNSILGWIKLLQTREFDEAKRKRALETIERNAKLQTQLIDDLLDVSRILRGKMTMQVCNVHLETVIDAALETVNLSAEAKGIQIRVEVADDIGVVSGDPGRLQQVVWNLLANAVKFTPTDGMIDIRLSRVGRYAQVQVCDTGKGIEPSFLPYVFEYFRQEDGTTTRKFGGLGLGLAIVRYLTELHGGTVQAQSAGEGLGATFTILLPIAAHASAAPIPNKQPDALDGNTFALAHLRILVVDDDPDMRDLTCTMLEQAKAEAKAVASALEALAQFPEFQPDLLISDIGMPDIDGYELIRRVRSLPPTQGGLTPAIALTAYAGEKEQKHALAAGFQAHLSKPIEPEEFIKAVIALVRGH